MWFGPLLHFRIPTMNVDMFSKLFWWHKCQPELPSFRELNMFIDKALGSIRDPSCEPLSKACLSSWTKRACNMVPTSELSILTSLWINCPWLWGASNFKELSTLVRLILASPRSQEFSNSNEPPIQTNLQLQRAFKMNKHFDPEGANSHKMGV